MKKSIFDPQYAFEFEGQFYCYGGRSHIQCEFCQRRAQWNAIDPIADAWRMVCDSHFLERCEQNPETAVRFHDPRPGEVYTLTTVAQILQGYEALQEIYKARRSRLCD